ncbi:protein SRG1-like [Triticum aestivum]|nr:protein SRG1-like [Triticum aestivum]
MLASAKKVMLRDEITDATAAAFAGSTVIPDRYVWPDETAGRGSTVVGDEESLKLIPVLDMASLLDGSPEEIAKLGAACRDWGFFQLRNHGVDETVVERVKDSTREFFRLPLEKKKAVGIVKAEDGFQGFGHHFNTSTGKLDWAESLLLGTQPMGHRNMDLWPTELPTFRDGVEKYSLEMTKLKSLLMASMAIDLGIKPETLLDTVQGKIQNIVFHHYPPCRHNADKVIGIPPHTDGLFLTIVLEVDATPGLQVSNGGRWFPVRPLPGSLTVFVGDILEVLTNGRYKSVEHRVLVDAERDRTTIATFQDACVAGMVKPLPELAEVARYISIEKHDYVHRQFQALTERANIVDSLKI